MKYVSIGVVMLCASIIQGTLLSVMPGGISSVDVSLVIAVILSLLMGPRAGIILGIASGFIEDAVFGRPLGITGMSRMFICGAAGYLESKVFKDIVAIPALAVFVATIADRFLADAMVGMIGINLRANLGWTGFNTLESLSNLVLAFILYKPLIRLNNRFGRVHRRY